MYFYDANMCGSHVAEKSGMTWRGNCHTSDSVDGGFHDAGDEGDCYDEVDGLYFNVSHRALYEPTKAYKDMMAKFGEDIVERKFYVNFG